MENIIVGGAWPYANGSLHIGHIAALLPGDVLARYFRAKATACFMYPVAIAWYTDYHQSKARKFNAGSN